MHCRMSENYEYLVLTSVADPGFPGKPTSKVGTPGYYLANMPKDFRDIAVNKETKCN